MVTIVMLSLVCWPFHRRIYRTLPASGSRSPASLPMSAPRMCRKRPSARRNITPNTVGKLYQGGTKVVPSRQFCERAVKLLWHRWTSAQRRLFGV